MTHDAALPNRSEFIGVLYLVRAEAAAVSFEKPLPETGPGAVAALREPFERGDDAPINNAGPRFYHFVRGGCTPAAVGADLLAPAVVNWRTRDDDIRQFSDVVTEVSSGL